MQAKVGLSQLALTMLAALQVCAGPIVRTAGPTNGIGVAAGPGDGNFEIEAASTVIVNTDATINDGMPAVSYTSVSVPGVQDVIIEIYQVSPIAPANPLDENVPGRTYSSTDVAFLSFDTKVPNFTFSTTVLAAPSSDNSSQPTGGIQPAPNQTTGGDRPAAEESASAINFAVPVFLPDGRYFFVPQVQVNGGTFFWLSGTRSISVAGVTPVFARI